MVSERNWARWKREHEEFQKKWRAHMEESSKALEEFKQKLRELRLRYGSEKQQSN